MIGREKVIKGIGICVAPHSNCDECPYNEDEGYECINRLRADALAILAEPEARVMTRDELAALAMDESDNVPVWYEYRIITDRGVITRLEASVLWWVEDGWWRRLGPVRMGWEDVRAEGYGVSWRVWTERPTEAQREAAEWE